MRIVSLLPSATEILFALGAGDDVVGVTFECDEPPEARTRRIVSTSALPEGLAPADIDAAVAAMLREGADLYHLDAGALADLDADLDLFEEFGLDSMDRLNIMTALTQSTGVEIPDDRYPLLTSMNRLIAHLATAE